jgi:hypothetical protein
MNDEKLIQEIELLKKEIWDLKKARGGTLLLNKFSSFIKRSFTKLHFVIGIVITVIVSSFIIFAEQITKPYTFYDGTVISASEVNANFDTLYETAWSKVDAGGIYYDSGNVGIGTTTPGYKFTVEADVDVNYIARIINSNNSQGQGLQIITNGGHYYNFALLVKTYGSNDTLAVTNFGSVGIGTASPNSILHVENSIANGWEAARFVNKLDGQGVYIQVAGTNSGQAPLWITSNNGNKHLFYIQANGNVGIGTTNPQGTLDVNGSIYQRGSLLHADYVFEPDYELESIEEHAAFMRREKHLKAVPKAEKDENGLEIIEIGANRRGILEELEIAHIYIEQLNEKINQQQRMIDDLNERLRVLEGK